MEGHTSQKTKEPPSQANPEHQVPELPVVRSISNKEKGRDLLRV